MKVFVGLRFQKLKSGLLASLSNARSCTLLQRFSKEKERQYLCLSGGWRNSIRQEGKCTLLLPVDIKCAYQKTVSDVKAKRKAKMTLPLNERQLRLLLLFFGRKGGGKS